MKWAIFFIAFMAMMIPTLADLLIRHHRLENNYENKHELHMSQKKIFIKVMEHIETTKIYFTPCVYKLERWLQKFMENLATWVNRCSEDLECLDLEEEQPLAQLSSVQADKMTLFFTELLDHDRDDVICDQDFDNFFEKLAHFADWSVNSSEFHILLEVKREFIDHFINPLPTKWAELPYYRRVCGPEAGGIPGRTTLEGWLARWALHISEMRRFVDLPLYLQYLCKILFRVVDRENTGEINKPALAAFYRSVVGLPATRVAEIIDTAYDRMTSNSYLILDYGTYVHCFTNWLIGKNPNGPGQWVLVPPKDPLPQPPFPVDYSALNTEPAKLEPYAPDKKTNRHSVIV